MLNGTKMEFLADESDHTVGACYRWPGHNAQTMDFGDSIIMNDDMINIIYYIEFKSFSLFFFSFRTRLSD